MIHLIKLKSKRENPLHKIPVVQQYLGTDWVVVTDGPIEQLIADEFKLVLGMTHNNEHTYYGYTGFEIDRVKNLIKVQRRERVNTINLLPQPRFIYEYEDTEVQCFYCEKKFSWRDLESDSDYDYYNDRVCPYCNTWSCCELEFERPPI